MDIIQNAYTQLPTDKIIGQSNPAFDFYQELLIFCNTLAQTGHPVSCLQVTIPLLMSLDIWLWDTWLSYVLNRWSGSKSKTKTYVEKYISLAFFRLRNLWMHLEILWWSIFWKESSDLLCCKREINISIYQYINISIYQYINISIYQYINISINKYINK